MKESIAAEKEQNRKIQDGFNSFYPYIPLFWENREMILNEPRYYSVKASNAFLGAMYMLPANPVVTLGELLQIWEKESIFHSHCEKCGGDSVVYRFGGSPLSGCLFECKNICLQCGNFGQGAGTHLFSELWRTRAQYRAIMPQAEVPASYSELIAACKKEAHNPENQNENPEIDFSENDNYTVTIGHKKLNTNEFTNLLVKENTKTD
ncbi:MAG: hypothetical protein LBQ28_00110 [Prevotellaceae bacterium]|jgi:hypothetical protein|nr:hypothetical protein [Prevotellaceae bacterium]